MKELSLEEKAKRYDEAIGRANDILKGYNPKEGSKATINYIFPELRKSEDERIRGKIIATIHLYYGEPLEDEAKEMVAWLEKQELTSNSYSGVSISPDNGVDILFDKKLVKHISGEEQAEQNLNACLSYIPDESLKRWLMDTVHAKYDKIAWSEEDEKRFKSCLNILQPKTLLGNTETINTKWFKSLKDRAQSQPKQEWKQENREELTEFENAMMHIGNSFFGENAGLDPNDTDTIKEQAELLLELAPKTEWSEEDRTMAFTLMRDVDQMSYISKEGKNERIGWLNSLDEKFASTESAWTEEDDMMLECVLDKIGDLGTGVMCKGWLKSLKNRIKGE